MLKIYWGIEIAHVRNTWWKKKSLTKRKSDESLKLHMLQIHKQKKKKDPRQERRLTLLFLLLLSLQLVSFDGCLPVPCPRDHDVHCHLEEDTHLSVNFVGIVERVIDWEELDNPQGHSQDTCQQTSEGLLDKPVKIQTQKPTNFKGISLENYTIMFYLYSKNCMIITFNLYLNVHVLLYVYYSTIIFLV